MRAFRYCCATYRNQEFDTNAPTTPPPMTTVPPTTSAQPAFPARGFFPGSVGATKIVIPSMSGNYWSLMFVSIMCLFFSLQDILKVFSTLP